MHLKQAGVNKLQVLVVQLAVGGLPCGRGITVAGPQALQLELVEGRVTGLGRWVPRARNRPARERPAVQVAWRTWCGTQAKDHALDRARQLLLVQLAGNLMPKTRVLEQLLGHHFLRLVRITSISGLLATLLAFSMYLCCFADGMNL